MPSTVHTNCHIDCRESKAVVIHQRPNLALHFSRDRDETVTDIFHIVASNITTLAAFMILCQQFDCVNNFIYYSYSHVRRLIYQLLEKSRTSAEIIQTLQVF